MRERRTDERDRAPVHRRSLAWALAGALVLGVLALTTAGAKAGVGPASSFDAPAYAPGTIEGQQGWDGSNGESLFATLDEAVVPTAVPGLGGQAWRISNAATSGAFGNQPFSPSTADEAGETSASSSPLSGGTRQPYFEASFEVTSAAASLQPGLGITVSPDRGDGARMGWLRIEDHAAGDTTTYNADVLDDGLAVFWGDFQDGAFVYTTIAHGLSRTAVHDVHLQVELVDGVQNDVATVTVGDATHVGTTWEDYFREVEGNPTRTVDSLLFRSSGPAAPGTAGAGFLFDDVVTSTGPLPSAPATEVVDEQRIGDDWFTADTRTGGAQSFSTQYGGAAGDGALLLSTDGSSGAKVQLFTDAYDGVRLADLSALGYSTYRDGDSPSASGPALPALNLRVDRDEDDVVDTYLVFEPYQDLGNAAVANDQWQTWDALRGGLARWWASAVASGPCSQASPCEWSTFLSLHPDARILEDPDGLVSGAFNSAFPGADLDGSLGVNLGSGNPGIIAAADRVVVGVDGSTTVHDLEPQAPTEQVVTVDDDDLDDTWHTADTRPPGEVAFATNLGGALGDGALELTSPDASNVAKAQLLTDRHDELALADVNGLSYATYRDSSSTGFAAGAPAINLRVDSDGDDVVDRYLTFEPYQQAGGNAAVLSDQWQTWDAFQNGLARWWSSQIASGPCSQGTPCPWWYFVQTNPEARILEDPDGLVSGAFQANHPGEDLLGSFGVNLGSFNPGLAVGADALSLTVGADRTTYDFEELPTVPGAPTGLTATLDAGNVALAWSAPADDGDSPILEYVVYRNGDEIATVSAPTTTHTDEGASPGVENTYTVRAVNAVGEGPDSNTASVTTDAVAPGAPTGLEATGGPDDVALSWNPPTSDGGSALVEYVVYRDGVELDRVDAPSTTYTDTTATPGTPSSYTVSAVNAVGEGPQSAPVSAGIDLDVPGAPQELSEGGTEVCLDDEAGSPVNGLGPVITLTWTAPAFDGNSAITGYAVQRDGEEIGTTDAGTLTFRDTTATAGTTVEYSVVADNALGSSEPSAALEVEVRAAPASFSDVSTTHPFASEVCRLVELGITTGYQDGTFKPGSPVTRQAMGAFLYRLAGEPTFEAPATPSFTDVGLSHPFYDEIEWLADTGITTGYPNRTFRPGATVTRQAMAAFMYRFDGEPTFEAPGTPSFTDVGLSHPFYDEIEWLADTGVSTGYQDGTFKPGARVTRQAMAAFLVRLEALD